jgi:hypothetical protein
VGAYRVSVRLAGPVRLARCFFPLNFFFNMMFCFEQVFSKALVLEAIEIAL